MQSQSWTLRLYDVAASLTPAVAAAAHFSKQSLRAVKRMERFLPDFGKFKLFGAPIHDDNIDVFSIPVRLGDKLILRVGPADIGLCSNHRPPWKLRRTPVRTRKKRKSYGSPVIVSAARCDK